mmetsp:Transcript_41460/g.74727  ORF Transcript_41460/g.74727 Transcript_41460/m.74727 type:complete len:563 (-) Transcript_41460:176-1864(-)|eukprot:CAMPEP_0201875758 /NCGR_PEP_ID=MMETSP0902-20130614/7639_1 /ASSEMBLY_ACC=CAM_ASM_000551 /TAXON_ID=420261 /ORGANISM="Thalassiosira antarctica, Strain CCMP982" /LENGTH=562 /DNA_ID=CAMNT_0048402871 /DNA_START=26 /DNA_END=1714 /DNA_ORIENTATION=+
MVVLARQRRRFGNPDSSPYSSSQSAHAHDGYHGNHAPPPSSRLFSQQTILLLLAGMGIGYVATVNMGHSAKNEIGLESIVKNLEQQRAAAAAAASFSMGSNDNNRGLSSPMNMMQNSHREATALLRGDGGSTHALYNHRSLSSSDNAGEVEAASNGGSDVSEDASKEGSDVSEHDDPVVAVGKKHTFREQEEVEDLSEAQQRFVETQKLIAAQSIPTATTPHVMLTPTLPDSKRKKIIITGGAGFVGSHLTDKLMMEGHEVIVVDNFFTGQKKNIEHWMHHPRFSLVVHDVTEPIMLEVDEIYHLACPASPPHYQYNPVKTIKTSTMGTINMLGLAKRVKAKILLTSTSEIYGDPKVHPQPESYWGNVNTIGPRSCYDEGKRVAETMMYSYKNQNNVDVRVARIFNTFGPRMHPNDGRVVSNFIIQSLQDKPLTIYGDGGQTRSFQYVSDLVDGLHALMNGGYDMPVNLGNPDEYTVKHFAEYIKEITGSGSEISFLPATRDDPTQRKPDISTAKRELEWEPKVTVKEGLQKTIAYFSRVLEESGEIIPTGQEASKPKPKVE